MRQDTRRDFPAWAGGPFPERALTSEIEVCYPPRTMDLGLSLGAFHKFGFQDALDAYKRLAERFDLTVVEINLEVRRGSIAHRPWDVPEDQLRAFAEPFRHRGVHLPFVDLNPISTNAGIREESLRQLRLGIEASSRMGMTYAVTHATGPRPGLPWSEESALWKDVFSELAELALEARLTLCIENGARLVRLERLLEVVKNLGLDHVRICLDTGHAHQRLWERGRIWSRILPRLDQRWKGAFRIPRHLPFESYGSLAGFLRQAERWVSVFHLHDRRGRTDHLGLGQGGIDFASLAPYLGRRPVVLEVPSTSEDALARQIELAQRLVDGAGALS